MTGKTRLENLVSEGKFELTRQLGWLDTTKAQFQIPIVIVGCGGVGSPAALCLAKEGFPFLTLIDDDKIEPHNLPNQMFPIGSEGKYKADMLAAICQMFGPCEIQIAKQKVQEVPELLKGIVITGLDTMAARADVWKMVRLNQDVRYLIDVRMGGQSFVIWAVDPNNPDHIDQYEEIALGYDDEGGEETACTERAIMRVPFVMAGKIAARVEWILTSKEVPLVKGYNEETDEIEAF